VGDGTVNLSCPKCGVINEFKPVTALRPETPELAALFRSQLNQCRCGECGTVFLYDSPLLFRDDARRTLIYFVPASRVADPDAALAQMGRLFQETFGDFAENERPACRLVLRRSHFIEKVALHLGGYDDRIIEYVKYMMFQHSSGLKNRNLELLYDFSRDTGCVGVPPGDETADAPPADAIRFLAFDLATGRPEYSLDFSRHDYTEVQQFFGGTPQGQQQLDKLFPGYRVEVGALLT
jgi:hypothetical protein